MMRLVLIDGECTFCQKSVQFIMKRDNGAFHFASLQSELGQCYVQQYHLTAVDSVILIEQGKAYIYSDAALRITAQLQKPWNFLRVGYILPRPVRDFVYKMIAKRRHSLLKSETVCVIPSEKDRARFLT